MGTRRVNPADTIEIRGSNRVRNQLRYLVKEYPDDVDDEIASFVRMAENQLYRKAYPPPPPMTDRQARGEGKQYERTGRLREGWYSDRLGPSLYILGNVEDYSGWVIGTVQAKIHQGRWWIAREEVQDMVESDLTPALTELLERKLAEQSE